MLVTHRPVYRHTGEKTIIKAVFCFHVCSHLQHKAVQIFQVYREPRCGQIRLKGERVEENKTGHRRLVGFTFLMPAAKFEVLTWNIIEISPKLAEDQDSPYYWAITKETLFPVHYYSWSLGHQPLLWPHYMSETQLSLYFPLLEHSCFSTVLL